MKSDSDSSTSTPEILPFALAAAAAGLSVVPPRMDGSKAPIGNWKNFQHFAPDEAQLRRWYAAPSLTGIGVITGAVSGNLEVLEFDDRPTFEVFKSAADVAGLGALVDRIEAGYCEASPKPGIHYLYRCSQIAGNTKLATRPKAPEEMKHPKDKEQVLIETRGEGGYIITAPSNGKTHPSGGCYSLLSGGFDSIETITPEERNDLFALAKMFHVAPAATAEQAKKESARNHTKATGNSAGNGWIIRPGLDFNARAVWAELLEAQGWTFVFRQGERDYWRRPGKNQGVSACTNWEDKDYFYCFSTSTELDALKPMDKFGFHARTCYGGDFTATAKALAEAGYGQADPAHKQAQPTTHGDADRVESPLPPLLYYDEEGKKRLVSQQEAAAMLAGTAEFAGIKYHPIHQDFYHYSGDIGIYERRPALFSESAVYRAIRQYSDDFPFSSSYVTGVTRCLVWETVQNFETDAGIVGFKNGVLRLDERQFYPHSPNFFLTSRLPFDWRPDAPEPTPVIDWLLSAVGGYHDQVQMLRAWMNACIVGRPDLQRYLEVVGHGGSGKGTFTRLTTALLGADAVHSTDLKSLEGNRFESAKMYGKKMVVITDAERYHGDVSMLKAITGEDRIRFEEKHKQAGESFVYGGMVMLAANQHTESTDYSSGIQRRRITCRFDHVVPANERRDLDSEFEPHLYAVAVWALKMTNAEVTHFLRNTGSAVGSLRSVRLEVLAATNPIAGWMLDNVIFDQNAVAKVGVKKRVVINTGANDGDGKSESRVEYEYSDEWLYPNFVVWCEEHGKNAVAHNTFSGSVIDVAKNMLGKQVKKEIKRDGARIEGMRLRRDEELCGELAVNSEKNAVNYVIDNDELGERDELLKVSGFSATQSTPDKYSGNSPEKNSPEKNSPEKNSPEKFESLQKVHRVHHIHNNQELSSPQVHHSSPQPAPNPLDTRILEALTGSPAGFDTVELHRQVGNDKGTSLAMLDVALLRLVKAGDVSKVNGKWVSEVAK